MNNISGWMSEEELNWLFSEAQNSVCVVEVGSWKGRSTKALLEGCKGHVRAVDHWFGNDEEQFMKEEAKGDKVFKEFVKNVGGYPNLIIERGTSEQIAQKYGGWTFDMIFIDAGHTYASVSKDIKLWLDKADRLICGHDYDFPAVKKAVDELIKIDGTAGSIWYKYINK